MQEPAIQRKGDSERMDYSSSTCRSIENRKENILQKDFCIIKAQAKCKRPSKRKEGKIEGATMQGVNKTE